MAVVPVETPIAVPATTRGFSEFGISAPVVEALALRNINGAFAIQALVLQDAIAGRDVLAKSRTGSGKTLAFAIPIVERLQPVGKPSALVLVPTRELAAQVLEEFRGIADVKGLRPAPVFGGVGIGPQAKRARHAEIIVATPGRLLDLLRRRMIRLDRVRICVLDEADRMLDMGFMPDVSEILSVLPEVRQTMLFSATLDGQVGKIAERFTTNPVRHEVREARPVVEEAIHRFLVVPEHAKVDALVRELAGERGLTLIFVRTKVGADDLARKLRAHGFGTQAMHGDMNQPARERALARFASGRADVLVATDVAARGLDVEHITHVVNFDLPHDAKSYVHRVGRTARAGRTGSALTLVTPGQRGGVHRMATSLKLHSELVEAGIRPLPPGQGSRPREAGKAGGWIRKKAGGAGAGKAGGRGAGGRRA